jgi:hypothetical protein
MSTVEVGQDKDVAARNEARLITSLDSASVLSILETTTSGLQVVGRAGTLGRGSHRGELEGVLVDTHNVDGVNVRDTQCLDSGSMQIQDTHKQN